MTATLIARLLARPLPPPRVVGRDFDIHVVNDEVPWVVKVARHDPSATVMKRREQLLLNEQAALVRVAMSTSRTSRSSIAPEPLGMTRLGDGRPVLIRRWAEGVSLAELVERALVKRRFQGARRWNDSTRSLLSALFDAVSALHAAGLVHNDLKPEDILVRMSENGFAVTLLDLGLAAPPSRSGPGGTLLWAAPERLDGEPGTVKTDIWSLGALVYLVLTGRPPYPEGEDAHSNAVDAKLARQFPIEEPRNQAALLAWQDLSRHGKDVGVDLCVALASALARDPKHRPKDVRALSRLFGLDPKRTRTTAAPASPSSSPATRRRLFIGGLAAAATALGILAAIGPVGRALGLVRSTPSDPIACEVMHERAERLCAGRAQATECHEALTQTTDCRTRATLLGACGGP